MPALKAAFAAMLLLGACGVGQRPGTVIPGTGSAGQRSYQVAGFSRVELAGPYEVRVQVGGAPSVRAAGDEEALEHLEIRLDGDRLLIGTQPGSWTSSGHAAVSVTLPSLAAVDLAGSGDIFVGALRAPQLRAGLAGSGNIVLERIEGDAAAFEIAGSGNIRAAGQVAQTSLEVAGSGNADLSGLQAQAASVSVVGSGDAAVRATGTASVSIMGSGDVTVTGGARCSVRKMGSGNVSCG